MSDIFEDMYDEGDALAGINTGTGQQLSSLVRELRKVEDQISDAEEHIKELKKKEKIV